MRKQPKNTSKQEREIIAQAPVWEPETLAAAAVRVQAEGFVPSEVLKADLGPEKYTKVIAILYRQWRFFREVRRPGANGDVHGFEWADPRFSQAQKVRMPEAIKLLVEQVSGGVRPKYTQYEPVTVRCRFLLPALAALPGKDGAGADLRVFERDDMGNILIVAYGVRAMIKKALPMLGKEQALAYRIGFKSIRIPASSIKIEEKLMPVVDEARHEGKGLNRHEAIPAGTEFEIQVMIPASIITASEWLMLLEMAGQFVHLSPARSSAYGEFEVVKG